MPKEEFPAAKKYAVKTPVHKFPMQYDFSPFSKYVTLNDMNVNGGLFERRQFDTLSSQILIAHNCYTYARSFIEANELAFSSKAADLKRVPQQLSDALGIVELIFTDEKWDTLITSNENLLNETLGM